MIVFFISTYKRLSNILRCNTLPRFNMESVATHSYFVSLLCMLTCNWLAKRNIAVNQHKVLQLALVHDLEESFSGDITAVLKHSEKEFAKHLEAVNMRAIKFITEPLGELQGSIVGLWQEAHEKETMESKVVAACDYLCGAVWAHLELERGNPDVEHMYQNGIKLALKYCEALAPIAEKLIDAADREVDLSVPIFDSEVLS